MTQSSLALGFYQEHSTAKAVLSELKRRKTLRFASIHHDKDAGPTIKRYRPSHTFLYPLTALLAIVLLTTLISLDLLSISLPAHIGIASFIALIGAFLFWRFSELVDFQIVQRFKGCVLIGETLILIQVSQNDVREAMSILRQVKGGHPVSFLLRPRFAKEEVDVDIPAEPSTTEQLQLEAAKLAVLMQHVRGENEYGKPLLQRLGKITHMLRYLRNDVADAEYAEQNVPLSAEWLLDNMYVIEGSIEDIKHNLPQKYYKELPKIGAGPLEGFPRIYAIAADLIKGTAARLTQENITNYLTYYQMTHPLTIGELWAIPVLLRFRLLEWIQLLAIRIDNRMREGEWASFWGNRLLYAARHESNRLSQFIGDLALDQPSPSAHFAEELLDHLFDEETVLPEVKSWLEKNFALPIAEILHHEQIHESSEQVVFSNAIKSLLSLSQLSWAEVFESVSPVDAILRCDPTETYSKMDFSTRNAYRERIELLARRSKQTEVAVAKRTLQLAEAGVDSVQKHIGYYLVDEGRFIIEEQLGYPPTFRQHIRRWIRRHPALVYLGGTAATTLLMETALWCAIDTTYDSGPKMLLSLLSFPVLYELSIQLVNMGLMLLLPPTQLPKMSFEKGLPDECKTLVVIPMMLGSPASIKGDIDLLEIRYLANNDPLMRFGLFSDYADAPQKEAENDAALLAIALQGIKTLERKYGNDRFFLFHRQRLWNESEQAWIGWERKRGKLECLNRLLTGQPLAENIVYAGNADALKGIRYVITLDADTQLPKDQGRKLVEILAHPLNSPCLSKDGRSITRGYTIIQPRVVTDYLQSKSSRFSRIFSEPATVDPYTLAISNIYQDLVGEGSYHGKGIYDVAAFDYILSGRFPKNHLLSHDLIEGAYVRVGVAGSVCLFDKHPEDYQTWSNRQHRWVRGDWQIIDWIGSRVPTSNGTTEANPLSWSNRWKIFDNLRRAVTPIFLIVLMTTAWVLSASPVLWTGVSIITLLFPGMTLFCTRVFNCLLVKDYSIVHELAIASLRCVLTIAWLPYEAYLSLDAFVRVFYRRHISHKNLLQWMTSVSIPCNKQALHSHFLIQLGWLAAFGMGVLGLVALVNPPALLLALPFCALWISAPIIVRVMDTPLAKRADAKISAEDRKFLRQVARRTWRYFDDFVGPQTHWLPPDNYQARLRIEVAQRTSPTNIGMWFFALMSAYDARYITTDDLIDKVYATLQKLKSLEKYEGHLLNWYNIQTLEPLFPRYVSSVDSGNFLASLWTLKQGIYEMVSNPLVPKNALDGIMDAYEILQQIPHAPVIEEASSLFASLISNDISHLSINLQKALPLVEALANEKQEDPEITYWLTQIQNQLRGWEGLMSRYLAWVNVLASIPADKLNQIHKEASKWCQDALQSRISIETLANGQLFSLLHTLGEETQREELSDEIKQWGKELHEALSTSQWLAGEKLARMDELVTTINELSDEMNFTSLYHPDRKLFAIGYNLDERKLDSSYYDLLASESRILSLAAIAKGDAQLEHWWSLGRPYTEIQGRRVLLSWGGTMFEYLMPLLFNKQFRHSLIGDACNAVVACQIEYGNKRGIPWGISESAFSAIDSHRIYQYKSFGIPGIGLKRGLEDDLVVSPYSSGLALAIDPQAAVDNLKRLAYGSPQEMLGPHGFYESIDFTRQHGPDGTRGVIVYTYMAHHQGMFMSAINNLLHDDPLIKRFHSDPRINGVSSLLYERIPIATPIKTNTNKREERVLTRLKPFSQVPLMGTVETPDTMTPKVNLLSNGKYSVMITNTGGGYSRWGTIDVSRWRADTTCDGWGSYYYIKDLQSGHVWSTAFQPTESCGEFYRVNFKEDKAEFRRRDHDIETHTEIVVSPEDDTEICIITLINHSTKPRYIELTSYIELVLAPHLADRSHPCFNKLFIETEALPEASALLAFRRLRAPDEKPIWAAHVVATSQSCDEPLQYETDRARFIGRGKSNKAPLALEGDLSNTVGSVLDPIFSLRRRLIIEGGKRVKVYFVTATTNSRKEAISLTEKYKDPAASHRAIELAWTYSQLELRRLRIRPEDLQLFQILLSRILYPHSQLRAVEERLKSNRLGQSGLWAQGISGDLPLIVVTVGDFYELDLVKQLLVAHEYWHLHGQPIDVVILNEEAAGYLQPLQDHLQNLIQAHLHRLQPSIPGSVYLKNRDTIPADELNLMLCTARAVLMAARGSLRQQLVAPMLRVKYPPKLLPNRKIKDQPSPPLPFMELPYFNGLGGFQADGKAYVIYLDDSKTTPAPWINVLSNPQFGTLVSESGLGTTWYGNSQSNRLTPWSNDPLLDPITDTIYIRDEELGTIWTPTPAPIREADAYRISHGQGFTRFEHNSHGIGQELVVFVPVDDAGGLPLRIQRLRLTNHSSQTRRLSVTAYSEWVLGGDKEDTQPHIITEWDSESQAIFAYNRFHPDFGNGVAFTSSVIPPTAYTGNRTEFLGRNRSVVSPECLSRTSLSGHVGAGLDPCSALQSLIEIEPGKEVELVFIMGYAQDATKARQLIVQCRDNGMIEQLLTTTHAWWDKTLGTIAVDVPDLATNFLMNRWYLYQNLSSRFWGRSGFYQSSGAYGFRDQLQDSMALVYTLPQLAREHILKAASRQFIEGDVQHWWHPQSGGGIRTRFSDDLLWLPYTTAHYVRVTGDSSILDESVYFLEAPQLADDEHELYQVPTISTQCESLLEHCRRALQKGTTAGPHGLPLIGCGDWNDGMSRVGIEGKGESVWLAWFLIHVMHDFADLLKFSSGKEEAAVGFRAEASRLATIVEATAWDGEWYRRAYFDDGSPLGSKINEEATIDCIAQSWAVISGAATPERAAQALKSAEEHLVKTKENLVLLLTPPFDHTQQEPGYIKGYPPGVRENGGQYTHGSLWLAMAFARSGNGSKAVELLRMMSPTLHTLTPEANALYRVEPYVIAADIYDLKAQVGRGGWTWYTGSAAWIYRIWLEEVLGFKLRGQILSFTCRLPGEWNGFKLHYKHQLAIYDITVTRLSEGRPSVKLDGTELPSQEIPLANKGHHSVEVYTT